MPRALERLYPALWPDVAARPSPGSPCCCTMTPPSSLLTPHGHSVTSSLLPGSPRIPETCPHLLSDPAPSGLWPPPVPCSTWAKFLVHPHAAVSGFAAWTATPEEGQQLSWCFTLLTWVVSSLGIWVGMVRADPSVGMLPDSASLAGVTGASAFPVPSPAEPSSSSRP